MRTSSDTIHYSAPVTPPQSPRTAHTAIPLHYDRCLALGLVLVATISALRGLGVSAFRATVASAQQLPNTSTKKRLPAFFGGARSSTRRQASVIDSIFPRPQPEDDGKSMEYSKAMQQVLEREGRPLQDEKDLDAMIEVSRHREG